MPDLSLTPRDVRSLLSALLRLREAPLPDLSTVYYRQLSGGVSSAFVALVWLEGLPTLVLKAGPSDLIQTEVLGRQRFGTHRDLLSHLSLEDCSGPIEIEIGGRVEEWRAMAYAYVGGLTYEEAQRFSDFERVFDDFVASPNLSERPAVSSITDWLSALFREIASRAIPDDAVVTPGVIPRPLSQYLPPINWHSGLAAVLSTAAALLPESDELENLPDWWHDTVDRETLAPFPNLTTLHGDLRFANALVNRTTGEVELIDFAGVQRGHVFRDLARFEVDLLLRIHPPPSTEAETLSTEERRVRTLEFAFGSSFSQFEDLVDPSNRQIVALRLLRQTYDRIWHIGSSPARHRMYLCFLLAEVLKRLVWPEPVFSSIDGKRALLRAVLILKRRLDGEPAFPPGFASLSALAGFLGCRAAYVPVSGSEAIVNRARNAAKIAALRAAAADRSTVRLLAETGNSYLHFRGPFFPEIESLVQGGSLRVVLANPFFLEGHGISLAFRDPHELNADKLHPLFLEKVTESLSGYEALRAAHGGHIEVRVARFGLGATILCTSQAIFFEPYIRSDRTTRHRRLFDTFELQLDGSNEHARRLFDEHFHFYWNSGLTLQDVMRNEGRLREALGEILTIVEHENEST